MPTRLLKGASLAYVLRFLLFILVFVLVTVGICGGFSYLRSRTAVGYFDILSNPSGEEIATPQRIVILDAGHGGEDGGASGADGTLEKELNLSVTTILADLLRAEGITVVMTRDSDRMLYDPLSDHEGKKKMLDLRERLEIARRTDAENEGAEVLFISIHMNAYPDESVHGFQVWYSPNAPESEQLAEAIQASARRLLDPQNHRKIKKAGTNIYLMNRISVPAVLVECGFLSNPDECARLKEESYQKKIAEAICEAVRSYTPHSAEAQSDSASFP